MNSRDLKRRLIAVGLFGLPAVIVQVTGAYMGRSGPTQAQAASDDSAPTPVAKSALKAPTWTARQIAAGAYATSLSAKPMPVTPFLSEAEARYSPETVSTNTVIATPTIPGVPAPPKFVLQVILASNIGHAALIDGKPCREGEEVRDTGWIVESINSDTRSATLRDSVHDRTITIAVELPNLNQDN